MRCCFVLFFQGKEMICDVAEAEEVESRRLFQQLKHVLELTSYDAFQEAQEVHRATHPHVVHPTTTLSTETEDEDYAMRVVHEFGFQIDFTPTHACCKDGDTSTFEHFDDDGNIYESCVSATQRILKNAICDRIKRFDFVLSGRVPDRRDGERRGADINEAWYVNLDVDGTPVYAVLLCQVNYNEGWKFGSDLEHAFYNINAACFESLVQCNACTLDWSSFSPDFTLHCPPTKPSSRQSTATFAKMLMDQSPGGAKASALTTTFWTCNIPSYF